MCLEFTEGIESDCSYRIHLSPNKLRTGVSKKHTSCFVPVTVYKYFHSVSVNKFRDDMAMNVNIHVEIVLIQK